MYIIIAILILPIFATNWAVLVAGSNGFYNYRHQSDVCHAYKTLIRNQINPENIIIMAYDDIAYHQLNRFKGGIYNNATWDGFPDNVYDGCKIDYKQTDVNPNNFVNILLGNADLVPDGFPVLTTNNEDNIFIYFSDHGAPGLIAFPFSYLYEQELLAVFKQMYERNLYNKIIFYLETCESGSMFVNLPNNWRIYAVSAANPEESSYGIYCPPQDLVNGYRIGTCLGDEFSVSFLEHLDEGNYNATLKEQFQIVQKRTKGSHVLQWGDLTFLEDQLFQYFWGNMVKNTNNQTELHFQKQENNFMLWNSRDVKLLYLQNLYATTQLSSVKMELLEEQNQRNFFDNIFLALKNDYNLSGDYFFSENQECLKNMIQTFENHCLKLSDYGLKYVKYFNELCRLKDNKIKILEQINSKCSEFIQKN